MELRVHLTSTDKLPEDKDDISAIISELPFGITEQNRLLSIRNAAYLRNSLCGLIALRELASALSLPLPHTIRRTELGKPIFEDTSLGQFSISHSESLSIATMTDDPSAAVGIDVEFIRSDMDIHKIAERFFAPKEYDEFKKKGNTEAFFLTWTKKEAIGKLLGTGLTYGGAPMIEDAELFSKSYHIIFKGREAYLTVCCKNEPEKIIITHNTEELNINEIQNRT